MTNLQRELSRYLTTRELDMLAAMLRDKPNTDATIAAIFAIGMTHECETLARMESARETLGNARKKAETRIIHGAGFILYRSAFDAISATAPNADIGGKGYSA